MKNIAINAVLLKEQNSGVENYIENLLCEFDKFKLNFTIFLRKSLRNLSFHQSNNFDLASVPLVHYNRVFRIGWEQTFLPFKMSQTFPGRPSPELANKNFDLLHAPAYIMPLGLKIPVVTTIHDIIALTHPKLCSRTNALYYHHFLPPTIQKSHQIIVPSFFVKNQILERSNINPRKIHVIYEGISKKFGSFVNEKDKQIVREKYHLPDRFVLFVGNLEPKKNLPFILQLFDALNESIHNLGLVLVGKTGWKTKSLLKQLKSYQKTQRLVLTGYIPNDDLAIIYQMATLFIFPSIVEGFGVPPLEAMASGVPTIVSNKGSLPEIVADASITLDLNDFNLWKKHAKKVICNNNIRSELIEKGYKRIRNFCWKKAAHETIDVYNLI